MAAEADIMRYMITGEEGEMIPENATHVSVHPTVKVIPRRLFFEHRNIVELICHDGVFKIERWAFIRCPRLKRVIMKGVEEVEWGAFDKCEALEYVECDKLEIIGEEAFSSCNSMTSFNLPSAKIVLKIAFRACEKLKYVKFGKKLETVNWGVFFECRSLEHITIPLKNGLIQRDDTFQLCENLRRVDFVEEAELQETIDALLCDEWRNDMVTEIDSINQTLPHAYAGHYDIDDYDDVYTGGNPGEKAKVIRNGIVNVLYKIIRYKSQHRRLLKEAACRLQLTLPHVIVINTVTPFLMLPQHSFDGEIEGDDGELDMNSDDEDVDESHTSRLGDEGEEDSNECSKEEDTDELIEELNEEVMVDGARAKRRKMAEAEGDDEEVNGDGEDDYV